MRKRKYNNYAFIDAQNLHMAIEQMGWKLDYKRFRIYLKEHYSVTKAYMFMGFQEEEQDLYDFLSDVGFELVFKPLLEIKDGKVKGNCDAELVLQAIIDMNNYDKAIIVSGDGDFHCLMKYLQEQKKLLTVLVPSERNCSALIKRIVGGDLTLISDLKKKLKYVKGKKKLENKKVVNKSSKKAKEKNATKKKPVQKKVHLDNKTKTESKNSKKNVPTKTQRQEKRAFSKKNKHKKKASSRQET